MIELITHRFLFFTRKEFWLYDGEDIKTGTYNSFSAAKQVKDGSLHLQPYNAPFIDLTPSTADLLNAVDQRLRYDLKLAEKKGMELQLLKRPTDAEINEITRSFNAFAKDRPIAPLTQRWMQAARRNGNLLITHMLHNGKVVVTHLFLTDGNTVLNTQSYHDPSFHDASISKFANKLLHWKEILLFKEMGYRKYSFGPASDALKGITRFKMSFGSHTEVNYRFIQTSPLFSFITKWKRKKTRPPGHEDKGS